MTWSKRDEELILGKDWRRNSPQEQFRCTGCFRDFWRDKRETWKVHCNSCWQHSPQAKRETRDKLTALLAERESVIHQLAALKLERKKIKKERDEIEKQKSHIFRYSQPERAEIPDDILARMIRLCHPDRNENSEPSNQVTAWLLAQRQPR